MKNLLACILLGCAMSLRAADEKPAAPASPLAPVASLVGGLWVAELPPQGNNAPMKLEARFEWTENHQAVRFESAFVQAGKRSPYTSGIYVWNPAKQKIAIVYTDFSGSLTEGLITLEGQVLENELTLTHADGKAEPVRVRLTKSGADGFTNEIFVQKDGAMVPFITVKYLRGN